ncbi:predicted protein [Phaeodactylum tricornutum CCAP 1055/1]|uniref:Selenoprotein O n=2 Tax=Phaeodactylum tricornutum TaxID=2850 RepID=B7G845_PHATC|nr:predicted protein [Phaeodactylum tricornutum CCAP 1055/1]EEC44974.1 predicted protein [Phaeodactylum tricornutum CCAP 1055/1]|eukprot:XP_002183274.1 predicted protein [Phaeodactylum tricornutum CCAP 1055/1]
MLRNKCFTFGIGLLCCTIFGATLDLPPLSHTAYGTSTGPNETPISESLLWNSLVDALDNTWLRHLSSETRENLERSREIAHLSSLDENRTARPVYNGHYVAVRPTGLPQPRLLLYSPDVAHRELTITPEQIESEEFLAWISGNQVYGPTWATPYALSIMGERYTSNCPFRTGDGYGDGRAISIGEFWGQELQLKGAGTTPFSRSGDGRAVLRSSVREFLASEAMYALGVDTTRALSLVISDSETISRPWYNQASSDRIDHIERVRHQDKQDPNMLVQEKTAITCRVSMSFIRIGHFDLYARRSEKKSLENFEYTGLRFDTTTAEWHELEQLIWHTCFREFRTECYDPFYPRRNIAAAAALLLDLAAEKIATMVAGWIRVGFAQGNFNADNCLVAGRTVDYGPFGFVEEFDPTFSKWTGSGTHFGFMNQPSAALANYKILVESVVPVIAAQTMEDMERIRTSFLERAQILFEKAVSEVFRIKLGFSRDQKEGDRLWNSLQYMLRHSRTDWTIFFRQLSYITRSGQQTSWGQGAFYDALTPSIRQQWIAWLEEWSSALSANRMSSDAFEQMISVNPKFVLREWMLVKAYRSAEIGEDAELFYLHDLIQAPYSEGSPQQQTQYYRRASEHALTAGGTAFMS